MASMERARGVRDFPPEVQLIREDLMQRIRRSFERHGFSPFASPVIERKETLTFKFSREADVMKELFVMKDQGGRELGLRFDLTVPLCRYIANNKDLKLPFKRYEIGRVYRDGPIKLGRYREFWQCDADIVGSSSMMADAECIKCASDMLSTLPFGIVIKVNSRKILNKVMDHLGIQDHGRAMIVIDKLYKQGESIVRKELSEFLNKDQVDKLFSLMTAQGTNNGKLKFIEDEIGICEGIAEMRELLGLLENIASVEFDPSLSRGLDYYTGSVFEAFLTESKIKNSVAGGGRYDNLIGEMMGAKNPMPAVGISIGIEPITDALLEEKHRFDRTPTKVLVIPVKTQREAATLADRLRAKGINTDIDVMGRSLSKNLDYADKLGIPYVMVLGQADLQARSVTLRNMQSGKETKIKLDDIDTLELEAYS